MTTAVSFTPIKPHIGSTVSLDRSRLTDPDVVAAIRHELDQRGVLVFPAIGLTDEEQLAFTDAFGERLDYTRSKEETASKSAADINKISFDKDARFGPEYVYATWFWHMDGVLVDQPLPKATMLSARKVSPTGGQTEFCSTFAAWDLLPEATRQEIEGLEVIHRLRSAMRYVFGEFDDQQRQMFARAPDMVAPLVWTQRDGRRSLVLGCHADEVLGMGYAAGRSLIERLMQWSSQPEFSYSHEWTVGDFVIWNNHGVMHRVVPYAADSGRSMHRSSITGDLKLGRPLQQAQAA